MASTDLVQYNADTYNRMWRFAHFIPPNRTPWWPLMKIFAQQARDRLEIGPGPWPKLPVEGTHVVDLSAPALELLARQGALVHRGLLHEIGFPEGAFDLVGLFEVLEHVPDDTGLLHELGRITRPGGRLVVSVPLRMDFYNAFDRWAGHVRRYEPDELLGKLAQAGFVIDCFEVRPETGGRAAAVVLAWFCRFFPRFSMWVTERLLLPAMLKTQLLWTGASQWGERMRDAGHCTVVCKRA